jgi:hypothetical protein
LALSKNIANCELKFQKMLVTCVRRLNNNGKKPVSERGYNTMLAVAKKAGFKAEDFPCKKGGNSVLLTV